MYERLSQPGNIPRPPLADTQMVTDSPVPTARSGHGAAILDGKIFVMGGEGSNRVFGQNEGYDVEKDHWEQYAPMPTPRHGLGAAALGNAIYVAGGGSVMGGGVQTSIHEAFTLASA